MNGLFSQAGIATGSLVLLTMVVTMTFCRRRPRTTQGQGRGEGTSRKSGLHDQPSVVLQILNLARWAPSGDNAQSWRFEVVDDTHVRVHCSDTRDRCIYDLDGHSSQIAFGALLENVEIAASSHGLRADVKRDPESPLRWPVFDVHFTADPSVTPSHLVEAIEKRAVQRRPMSTRRLTASEKQKLLDSVGSGYRVVWRESLSERWQAAHLMFNNAKLRLTMPEAFETHRSIIEWDSKFSEDKVPDQSLGVDTMSLCLMRWAMRSWSRMSLLNTVLGTAFARLQMDLIPGLFCAAHCVIKAKSEPQTLDDYVATGRVMQRFWLTLAHLDLYMQPELTPLIFSRYVKHGLRFSRVDGLQSLAESIKDQADRLTHGDGRGFPIFMGRVGAGPAPVSRSVRLPLTQLMWSHPDRSEEE